MSKKKNQKAELKLLANKTDMEKFADSLFNKLIIENLKINKAIDNDYIKITPFCESDFGENKVNGQKDPIIMYEICPKANPNVLIYLDENGIDVIYKKKTVLFNSEELTYFVSNIIEYLRKYCKSDAAWRKNIKIL